MCAETDPDGKTERRRRQVSFEATSSPSSDAEVRIQGDCHAGPIGCDARLPDVKIVLADDSIYPDRPFGGEPASLPALIRAKP